jgi:flagellin
MTGQADSNERLILQAAEAGSDKFVNVYVAQGSFDTYDYYGTKVSYATGSDVIATINGNLASSKGNNISINTPDLALSMNVANVVGLTGFSIDGGGALFQLGPDVVSTQQMRLGIGSMMTTRLGGASGQLYQLKSGGNADLKTSDASRKLADRIVNEAISTVATTRGRLGAIQKASLEPNISALQDSLTALTESEAQISNADFAEESSNLTRLQLLLQAGMQTLGIANQLPQYAASLVQ